MTDLPSDPPTPPQATPPQATPPQAPPPQATPPPSGSGSWPSPAKATVAVLAVLTVAAVIMAIIGFSSGDDDRADADAAEAELAAANERADAAEAELSDMSEQMQADIDAANADRDAAEEALATADADREAAITERDAAVQRADEAEALLAEVQEVVGQFPIKLDSSLIPDDMPGTYTITYQEAYCDGFATCGTVPGQTVAEIYKTDEGFLRIGVEGILDAGLFALDGSLYGITDSATALAPCGETPRRARITITMYAGNVQVLEDATRVVDDVNASITIDAPSEGPDCPSGLVFYASSLVPNG